MSLGDITFYDEGAFGYPGDVVYKVATGSTPIYAGEPVAKALGTGGTGYVASMATNKPVVATDFLAGIASSTSTNTTTATGTVGVTKMVNGASMLITPNDTTAFDTQAEYDALVGARVLLDKTNGTYTILAADGSTYGCVILPLDIAKHPGKVRFAFRNGVNYLT